MGRTRKKQLESSSNDENKNVEGSQINQKHKLSLEERQDINLEKHRKRQRDNKEKNENRSTDNFYCTNKMLTDELIKWRDSDPDPDKRMASNELAIMINNIATKLSNHSNFRNYPIDIKDEMISYARFKILKGLKHYRFEFNNPFAYITQGCWNAFLTVCGKYYKYLNAKREYTKRFLSKLEEVEGINVDKIYNTYFKDFINENDELIHQVENSENNQNSDD